MTVTVDDVRAAAERLAGVAHRTPAVTSRTLDELSGATVFLKAENLQRVGAFKFRGAYNAIASLPAAQRARGVTTVSSGNHAQAVSLAARLHGVEAHILMPEDAPANKVAATRGYGAEVIAFDRYSGNREERLARLVAERGYAPIHPYDDPHVLAGQGTVALELLEQAQALDVLLVPVGGGGLLGGCSTVAQALAPRARVIGVEPQASDDMQRSLQAGERVRIPFPRTIADGQQLDIPGELTFPIAQRCVDSVLTVSDEEIVAAMVWAFERPKLVLEPSGASALAALLAGKVPDIAGARVGVVLSGGNIDAARFRELTTCRPL